VSGKAPEKGDFVHIDFDPQAGHEQVGARFGLVLSPRMFNEATGFAFVAPLTGQVKGYPPSRSGYLQASAVMASCWWTRPRAWTGRPEA